MTLTLHKLDALPVNHSTLSQHGRNVITNWPQHPTTYLRTALIVSRFLYLENRCV